MIDVAIVGGGLAGCSAAITLARQGARVALFEAKTYPHHKVCGEFMSPECTYLLDDLGVLPALRTYQPTSINTVAISAPDGMSWQARLPGNALGISRYVLDECMAKHAAACGADVRVGTRVVSIAGSLDETFKLTVRSDKGEEQVSAKVVLGAQGKRSSVDGGLNRSFLAKRQPFVALKAHFYGPPLPHRINLHTFPGGYCGMSEIEDGKTNVCLLVREDVFRRVGRQGSEPIPAFIQWMQSQNARLGTWLSQAQQVDERWLSISQVPFVSKRVVENDLLMVGDSAGLIVPLAGDGMAMALQAGILGANCVSAFLAGDISADALRRDYASRWSQEFAGRLRLGHFLQAFMLRPALMSLGLRLLNVAPALGQYFIRHTRDTRPMTGGRQALDGLRKTS